MVMASGNAISGKLDSTTGMDEWSSCALDEKEVLPPSAVFSKCIPQVDEAIPAATVAASGSESPALVEKSPILSVRME